MSKPGKTRSEEYQRFERLRLLVALFAAVVTVFQDPPSSFGNSLIPGQNESKWARYSPDGEEFSALLPELPSKAGIWTSNKRNARKGGRMYGAYGDGVVYVIVSENNPRRKEKLETFIEEFRDHLPCEIHQGQRYSSEMTFDREVSVDGSAGKRYRLKISQVQGVVDFYITEKHVYAVESVGGDESNSSVRQFLESISFDSHKLPKNRATADLRSTVSPGLAELGSRDQETPEVFSSKEVTRRAIAVYRPEPSYTEEARKNEVSGTVSLRAIFSSSGKVTNIGIISALPFGLTEKAIVAAKLIRFIPATKDGKFVSQYVKIEYNFNLF
jgi:TonB family protein